MLDPNIVAGILGAVGTFLIAVGMFYKAWSETRRLNKESEIKAKRDELELTQLAARFNIETVTGASTSAVSVLTGIADRLKSQVDESDKQIESLKQSRAERDEQIAKMQERQAETDKKIGELTEANRNLAEANERLTKEVATLRTQLNKKDEVIQEQDGRIKQQEKRIAELEGEYKRVQTQVDLLVERLKEANLPLPDGVEHEGNGEKESGGKDE